MNTVALKAIRLKTSLAIWNGKEKLIQSYT